jgi:hypothetical protein
MPLDSFHVRKVSKYLLKRAQTNRNGPLNVTVIKHYPGKDAELAKQEKYRNECR